jgi:hypothetical protein
LKGLPDDLSSVYREGGVGNPSGVIGKLHKVAKNPVDAVGSHTYMPIQQADAAP